MDHDTERALKGQLPFYSFNEERSNKYQMRVLTLLLYLISQNADITPNPDQSKIYRAPSATTVIKDKFREIEIFDIGFNIGNELDDSAERAWDCSMEHDKLVLNCSIEDENAAQIRYLEKTISELRREINMLKTEAYNSTCEAKKIWKKNTND